LTPTVVEEFTPCGGVGSWSQRNMTTATDARRLADPYNEKFRHFTETGIGQLETHRRYPKVAMILAGDDLVNNNKNFIVGT
jgi:hypothetical protein